MNQTILIIDKYFKSKGIKSEVRQMSQKGTGLTLTFLENDLFLVSMQEFLANFIVVTNKEDDGVFMIDTVKSALEYFESVLGEELPTC